MSRTLIPLSLLFRRLLCCVKKAQKLLAPPAWKQTTSSGNSHQRQILNVDFSVIRPLSIAYSTYPKLSLPRPLKYTSSSGTREKGPKKNAHACVWRALDTGGPNFLTWISDHYDTVHANTQLRTGPALTQSAHPMHSTHRTVFAYCWIYFFVFGNVWWIFYP